MTELIHGATSIQNGLKYHAENYQNLQLELDSLDFKNPEQDSMFRAIVQKMNNEAIAYFNRIGQFYYLARSQAISNVLADFEQYIPNIIRIKIFRMKQSAHRATDDPRNENPNNMAQLDRLFTYQFLLMNNKLFYQVMHNDKNQPAVNFLMQEDHPKIITETEIFINLISKE